MARFIIGTGRCGSTLLSTMLASHPDVASVSELFPSLFVGSPPLDDVYHGDELGRCLERPNPLASFLLRHRLDPPELLYDVDRCTRWSRQCGVAPLAVTTLPALGLDVEPACDRLVAWARSRPAARLADHIDALLDELRSMAGRRVWVERSGGSLDYVAALARNFPEARVVHLYRDGVETILSMERHAVFRLAAAGMELEATTGHNPYGPQGPDITAPVPIDVPPHLRGLHPAEFDGAAFAEYHPARALLVLLWTQVVTRGLRVLRRLDDRRVMHVSYDDLVTDTRTSLRRITDHFALEAPDEWLASAASLVTPRSSRTSRLDRAELRRLQRACRPGDERLRAVRDHD
jgi:hypothetical protein